MYIHSILEVELCKLQMYVLENCGRRKMKAIVSVTFDNEFVVHDIKVIEGQNGLLLLCLVENTRW